MFFSGDFKLFLLHITPVLMDYSPATVCHKVLVYTTGWIMFDDGFLLPG